MISSFGGGRSVKRKVWQTDTGVEEYLQKAHFVMSAAQFDTLPNMLEVHIKKGSTNYCIPVDPELQLAEW